jgi:predicted phosphoadenosine phosphosulfate sulfurtransferase
MNVYEALIQRLDFVFSEFDKVVVSFSGGKDSGVLLSITMDYAKRTGNLGRLAVYHMDYEAQYTKTTEYVDRVFNSLPDGVDGFRVCLPVKAQCSTSMFQAYWQPWKLSEKDIWCRPMPTKHVINEDNFPWNFDYEISDYEFNIEFGKAVYPNKKVCFLIGIRTQESLNRWRTMNRRMAVNEYKGRNYTTVITDKLVNAYPLFDWAVEDVWTANARFGYDYNKVYDLMYLAGVPLSKMRVASPFNDCAQDALKLYKVLEPDTWGLLVGRVNGVNFTGLYGGTTAMGWKKITKPAHFTWKQYMYFLLDTLPEETRKNYLYKLGVSIKFWKERGGCLSDETIKELRDAGVNIEVSDHTNYKTSKKPVRMDYLDDIDIKEFKEIPTYKRMCICIIKNDHLCKYMGFSLTKDEMKRRKAIQEKYKDL